MRLRQLTGRRLLALFLIGVLLFNYPILAMFSRDVTVAGVPLLTVYVFVVWFCLILAAALVVRPRR